MVTDRKVACYEQVWEKQHTELSHADVRIPGAGGVKTNEELQTQTQKGKVKNFPINSRTESS